MLPSCVQSLCPHQQHAGASVTFWLPGVRPMYLPLSLCLSFRPRLCLSACAQRDRHARAQGEDATCTPQRTLSSGTNREGTLDLRWNRLRERKSSKRLVNQPPRPGAQVRQLEPHPVRVSNALTPTLSSCSLSHPHPPPHRHQVQKRRSVAGRHVSIFSRPTAARRGSWSS